MPRVAIKICGLTRPGEIEACARFGADAIGLNFHPGSPRYVAPGSAAPLVRALPPFMASVGVFVKMPVRQMSAIAYQLGLTAIQHHGEPKELADAFPFRSLMAFKVKDAASLGEIDQFLAQAKALGVAPQAILLDAFVPGLEGGTGQTAPWELIASYQPGLPIILAGGLTPDNVAQAIRQVRPWGVDVASGVESAPGVKDPDKIKAFIENARAA